MEKQVVYIFMKYCKIFNCNGGDTLPSLILGGLIDRGSKFCLNTLIGGGNKLEQVDICKKCLKYLIDWRGHIYVTRCVDYTNLS